ncbi:polyprotein [Motherwort yellow mottle virus]|uniref:Polyprotein n=1 Tax=Motherwort yellow mottle virus TaxID=1561160 RepID=A0A097IAK0_9SECO|nr:polyprotein [Motherwort yellow mottle virus]AIT59087.1 polyprotein [Motherwort yellow mottle virus]
MIQNKTQSLHLHNNKSFQKNPIKISSNRGREMATSTNTAANQATTQEIQAFMDAVVNAPANSKRKGMGCFTVVRGHSTELRGAELMERDDQEKVRSLWDIIRRKKVDNPDSMLQYYHLQGVVFIMVPHVSTRDQGEVTISLHNGNDQMDTLASKTFALAEGPAVAVMSAPMCIPLVEDQLMFYYKVTCTGSNAIIPCSVMAMWKQTITTSCAVYQEEETIAWALEKLRHPQIVKSSKAAAQLLSTYYNSGDRSADLNPKAFLGFNSRIKSMDIPAILNADNQVRETRRPIIESKRFGAVPVQHLQEEDDGESLHSAHLYSKLEAQIINNHDKAFFNLMSGFCGDQQNDSILGAEVLKIKSWILEEQAIQKEFNGCITPFDIPDEVYYEIGILPRFYSFLNRVFNEERDIDELRTLGYQEEVDEFVRLSRTETLDLLGKREELWLQELDNALRCVRVVVDCSSTECECGVFYHDAKENFSECALLEAQAGDVSQQNLVEEQNNFLAMADPEDGEIQYLDASSELFDFSDSVVDEQFQELEISQPVVVSSRNTFEVGVFEFEWKTSQAICQQLLQIPLPQAFNQKNNLRPAGVELLKFYDAGVLEFEAEVNLSASHAVTGELILIWDEGDIIGEWGARINQASLLAASGMKISAGQPDTSKLKFAPTGVGEFIPFDSTITSSRLGSLRLFVLYPIICAEVTTTFPGHVHLRARMLSSNIMQAPRLSPQVSGGMPIGEASIAEIACAQTLFSSTWSNTATIGESFAYTFSPASVFEQDGILQPSLLCNLFRNCKWWTGECEFELHFDRSVFHSGSLGIGFGTIASNLFTSYDIFNTTHVIANISESATFRFSVSMRSWNGKNLFATGRKSSLPKMSHQALLRIFATVIKPLVTTNPALPSVNFYLMLRRIKNLVVGGSTPIKPVFGHWKLGKSGTDFFYSESDGPQDKLLAEMLKQNLPPTAQPRSILEAQLSLRQKMQGSVRQYIIPALDGEKRYLVIPVAPWSYEFPGRKIVASSVNPHIDMCSSFLYWRGSLRYTLIFHRSQNSASIGGVVTVCFESSGYPIEPGLHVGKQPIATGGGKHWNLAVGSQSFIHSFVVQDDNFFRRRHTRYRKFDDTKSRIDTLTDRLGNLIIYLPSASVFNQVEIQVALGSDFQFSHKRVPTPAEEKTIGDMETHAYHLTKDDFVNMEPTTSIFKK